MWRCKTVGIGAADSLEPYQGTIGVFRVGRSTVIRPPLSRSRSTGARVAPHHSPDYLIFSWRRLPTRFWIAGQQTPLGSVPVAIGHAPSTLAQTPARGSAHSQELPSRTMASISPTCLKTSRQGCASIPSASMTAAGCATWQAQAARTPAALALTAREVAADTWVAWRRYSTASWVRLRLPSWTAAGGSSSIPQVPGNARLPPHRELLIDCHFSGAFVSPFVGTAAVNF